jgi:cyclophilin family peptidyl-prolyl cis-trans isomerase
MLEGRQLLAASIAPISTITAPTTVGVQLPLQGTPGTPQTYTVTSDNPAVGATIAQGKFLTITVTHASSGANDPAFTGSLTFQLFQDLTPLTASRIEQLVSQGFYTNKTFHRITNQFPGPSDFIVQGGSVNGSGGGDVAQPGFPFPDEFVQQIAFTGQGQLAMANAGPDTNSSQFFITTGSPRFLDYKHTIFGQLVEGQPTLRLMTQVAKQSDNQTPVSAVLIKSATLSDVNPDGVIHIDTTHATAGQTADLTVKATDPATGTTATRTFQVVVTPNVDQTGAPVNERAFLAPVQNQVVGKGQTAVFQLQAANAAQTSALTFTVQGGVSTDPTTGSKTFTPVQNATASVDANGVVTVKPNAGFTGPITLLVGVRDQANSTGTANPNDPSNFDTQVITLTVTNGAAVNLPPIAVPGTAQVVANTPKGIQLAGNTANPESSQTLTFSIVTPPAHGTISAFNPSTGTFIYTPNPNFQGFDALSFRVRDVGAPTPNLDSTPAVETISVLGGSTGAVRLIGRVLVVTPLPRTDKANNTVTVTQSNGTILVNVNGLIDSIQPPVSALDQIVAYGSKAGDTIAIAPDVTVPATLDGGHGGGNALHAGGGPTIENAWFGQNTLAGGPANDTLVGRAGQVHFVKSAGNDIMFAGVGQGPMNLHHIGQPPTGTFYRFVGNRLVPTKPPKFPVSPLHFRNPPAQHST